MRLEKATYAGVAQQVEHLTENQGRISSILVSGTISGIGHCYKNPIKKDPQQGKPHHFYRFHFVGSSVCFS